MKSYCNDSWHGLLSSSSTGSMVLVLICLVCCGETVLVVLYLQLSEMTADFVEENTTSNTASELLEVETAERMRLEKDFKDLQVTNIRLIVSVLLNYLVDSSCLYNSIGTHYISQQKKCWLSC